MSVRATTTMEPPVTSGETRRRAGLLSRLAMAIRYVWRVSKETVRYCRMRPTWPSSGLDYDDYWGQRFPVEVGHRFRILTDQITAGARVLDLGCGEGTLLQHLIAQKGVRAKGIDLSETAVAIARSRGVDAVVGDVASGALEEETFDHVVCGEFLEHVPEPERILLSVKSRVEKTVLVTLPNVGYYQDRLRLLCGRFPVQWLHHPAEHLRFFTVIDFLDLSRDLGYRVRSVHGATGFPILKNRWPNLFAQQVVYELEVVR